MPVNADSKLVQQFSDTTSDNHLGAKRATYDAVIRWAPLAVPLFAVLLMIVVAFIDWSVLTPSM